MAVRSHLVRAMRCAFLKREVCHASCNPGLVRIGLQSVLDEVERHYIVRAMSLAKHKKTKAAVLLGFNNYQALSNRMAGLGLSDDDIT